MQRTRRRATPFGATGTTMLRENFAKVDASNLEHALADVAKSEHTNVLGER